MIDLQMIYPTKPIERKVVEVLQYSSINKGYKENLQKPFKILHRVPVERMKGRLFDSYA